MSLTNTEIPDEDENEDGYLLVLTLHQEKLAHFETKKAALVQAAAVHLCSSLIVPKAVVDMIIARESLKFDGVKLKASAFSSNEPENWLSELDTASQEITVATAKSSNKLSDKYTFTDPSRLGAALKEIGFTDECIREMRAVTCLQYDAALWAIRSTATSNELFSYLADLSCQAGDHSAKINEVNNILLQFKGLMDNAFKTVIDEHASACASHHIGPQQRK